MKKIALLFLLTFPVYAAETPVIAFTNGWLSVTATDNVTTGFDIYYDGAYFESLNVDQNAAEFMPPVGWCEAYAVAWQGGGFGHSSKTGTVVNPSCQTQPPLVTEPATQGDICIDSIAYVQSTGVVLSQNTFCF